MIEKTCVRVLISGIVQGVGFRWRTKEEASRLGITGWIANRPDGEVEAVFQGTRGSIDEMLLWARQSPPGSKVSGIRLQWREVDAGLRKFQILE